MACRPPRRLAQSEPSCARSEAARSAGAAAASAPFLLEPCAEKLRTGASRLYQRRLLRDLAEIVRRKNAVTPEFIGEKTEQIRSAVSRMLELMESILCERFDVLQAGDGEEGVRIAKSGLPDVILLDLGLPDLDGIEVIRRIREWSQVPIIVLSVREREDDKVAAYSPLAKIPFITTISAATATTANTGARQSQRRLG